MKKNIGVSLRCPGLAIRTEQWRTLLNHREALRASLKDYLSEPSCVANAADDGGDVEPHIKALCSAYVALVRIELTGHSDTTSSIRCMRSIAILFAELWRVAAEATPRTLSSTAPHIPIRSLRQKNRPLNGLDRLIESSQSCTFATNEQLATVNLAELISCSYCKAYSELTKADQENDIGSVRHHAALLADVLNEMLNVAIYMQLRKESDFSEFQVPAFQVHLGVS